jgi:Ca2+-binding RTX toxin-like protein
MSDLHSSIVAGCGCPFCSDLRDDTLREISAGAVEDVTGGADAAKPALTLSQITTQLRTQWGGNQEGKTWSWLSNNVTYSMPDAGPAGEYESAGYVQMTALMKERAVLAFELWDDVVAISLAESVNNTNADITFNYSSRTDGNGTYAYWNGYSRPGGNYEIDRAYIWLNSGWSSHNQNSDMFFGGYGLSTYLHEIGHTLGLSHAGTYNAGSGGTLSYAASAEYFQDSAKYTVMSYWDADAAEPVDHYGQSGSWLYASTPLLHDVAALQAAYGADLTTRVTNTTYGFNSNADRAVFDFTVNRDPILCIWDAGGVDTLDCSGYSNNQYLNLNAGTFSDVGFMTDNVSIAFGAVIENAVGGSGSDVLVGNSTHNALSGGQAMDTYVFSAGGWGADIIIDVNLGGRIVFAGVSNAASLLGQFTASVLESGYRLAYAGSEILLNGVSSAVGWSFGYTAASQFSGSWTTIALEDLVQSGGPRTLTGSRGNDTMRGESGDDFLNGAAGADRMIGGAGSDTYVVDNQGDVIDETNGAGGDAGGNDVVRSSITFSLSNAMRVFGDVESLELIGSNHINGSGNAGNNLITGNAGNNILVGLSGADSLDGAGGRDTASYAASDAGVTVSLSGGLGSGGHAQGDTLFFIENVIGSDFDDTIEGNAENNVLNGGKHGADGDSVTYSNALAGVTVSLAITKAQNTYAAGKDTLIGFENLTGSAFADKLTGNAAKNVLTGGDSNDVINGGAGADTLIGGSGNDVYIVDNVGDVVDELSGEGIDTVQSFVSFGLSEASRTRGELENLTLLGSSKINGSGTPLNNVLIGNSGANILTGWDGDDFLNGAAGADRMIGGAGSDTYVVDNTGDIVDEADGAGGDAGGNDVVRSSITFSLANTTRVFGDVEALELIGSNHITGTGNAGNNLITGNAGNNILVGLGGADTLDGAGGRDTASYAASDAGVTVSLTGGVGSGGHAQGDTLFFIENVIGSNFDDTIEGNAENNVLNGRAHGADGDTVSYSNALAGVTVSLASTKAQNTYGAGTDTLIGFENLTGSAFADKLTGNAAKNILTGGDGNDVIDGGAGADTLIGGSGSDVFVFKTLSASTPAGYDVIIDFESGLDTIDISAIDANSNVNGNQAFQFGGESFLAVSRSVTWWEEGGNTIVQADVNGNSLADFRIVLVGVELSLDVADFVL